MNSNIPKDSIRLVCVQCAIWTMPRPNGVGFVICRVVYCDVVSVWGKVSSPVSNLYRVGVLIASENRSRATLRTVALL